MKNFSEISILFGLAIYFISAFMCFFFAMKEVGDERPWSNGRLFYSFLSIIPVINSILFVVSVGVLIIYVKFYMGKREYKYIQR